MLTSSVMPPTCVGIVQRSGVKTWRQLSRTLPGRALKLTHRQTSDGQTSSHSRSARPGGYSLMATDSPKSSQCLAMAKLRFNTWCIKVFVRPGCVHARGRARNKSPAKSQMARHYSTSGRLQIECCPGPCGVETITPNLSLARLNVRGEIPFSAA